MKHLKRRTQICIDRLRINNAMSNSTMVLVGRADSPSCSHCPDVLDSAEHRLLHCPHYHTLRSRLHTQLDRVKAGTPLSLQSLLGSQNFTIKERCAIVAALATFLEESLLSELFLWKQP
jgi:hypothetical protein